MPDGTCSDRHASSSSCGSGQKSRRWPVKRAPPLVYSAAAARPAGSSPSQLQVHSKSGVAGQRVRPVIEAA